MNENNFYSVDRLLEFGMSMAVAQQMIKSMNNMMANMHIPGSMNHLYSFEQSVPNNIFYAIINGKQEGPFSETEFARLVANKKIVKETYIWKPGMTDWQLAGEILSVLQIVAITPPQFNGGQKESKNEN
ncbi:MAG: DUF4339 domain-containing protein [Spirochaetales bacterium]|jgi:hypothetical protein|nr:DUF4339 domain-containing protein [Spirochaetales bacterium]